MDVSVIVNCHNEGAVLETTFKSVERAIEFSRAHELETEIILIIDKPTLSTTEYLKKAPLEGWKKFEVDFGDLGLSRNFGVQKSSASYLCFVDGDDLISENWIYEAFKLAKTLPDKTVLHPQVNVYFGKTKPALFFHIDSQSPMFDPTSMLDSNKWTALCFSKRENFLDVPYRKNRIDEGIGFEDWHWNCETLHFDFRHMPVPRTCHFIREKQAGSLLQSSALNHCLIERSRFFRELAFAKIDERKVDLKSLVKKKLSKHPAIFKITALFYVAIKLPFQFVLGNWKAFTVPHKLPWLIDELNEISKFESELKQVPQVFVGPINFGFGQLFLEFMALILTRKVALLVLVENKDALSQKMLDYLEAKYGKLLVFSHEASSGDHIVGLGNYGDRFLSDDDLTFKFFGNLFIQSEIRQVAIVNSPKNIQFLERYSKALKANGVEILLIVPEYHFVTTRIPCHNEWGLWAVTAAEVNSVAISHSAQTSTFQEFKIHTWFFGLLKWGLVRKPFFCNELWFEIESGKAESIRFLNLGKTLFIFLALVTRADAYLFLLKNMTNAKRFLKAMRQIVRNPIQLDAKDSTVECEIIKQDLHKKVDVLVASKQSMECGISIIICTRDKPDLIAKILEGILDQTTFKSLQLVIVDNGTVSPQALQIIESRGRDPRVKILRDASEFNFSRLNNKGVREAKYENILFLNNDIEVIDPDWLTKMVNGLSEPNVGVVGAKLLYPNHEIQHAGVVLGMTGLAGHPFSRFQQKLGVLADFLDRDRWTSAVTGACLLTRKALFERTGGFDEINLPIAFSDVDYCLKVQKLGLKVLWKFDAVLIHRESVSRGSDSDAGKRQRFSLECETMLKRWNFIYDDPYYDRRLSLDNETCDLRNR